MMIREAALMTSFRLAPLYPLLVFLMVSGVVSQQGWGVDYRHSSICALNGSTIILGCSYTYPRSLTFYKAFWTKELVRKDIEPPDLSLDPNYAGRIHYLGNRVNDCSLRLTDVRKQDQGTYYFRFLTTTTVGKYQGINGVELYITELKVEIPDRVVEGDEVILTCKTTCRLTDTTFNWYKQGNHITYGYSANQLRLQSVKQKDAGSYSCFVNGQRYFSPPSTLDVQYPPKNTSVSIIPRGDIMENSSLTLNCSSDANPPAHSYKWFRSGGSFVGTGKTFITIRIRSEDSGDYTCKAENKHGHQFSTAVSLIVLYPPKNVSVSISPSDEILKGSSVKLTCSSDANPPVHSYTWYRVNENLPVGSGQSYSFILSSSSSGWFYCEAQNKFGSQRSAAVPLTLNEDRHVLQYVIIGVIAGCGALIAIILVLFIRRKRQSTLMDYETSGQDNTYIGADLSAANHTSISNPDVVNQDDVQYASIHHRAAGSLVIQASSSEATEEVQYASVQHRDRVANQTQEYDDLYANIRSKHSAPANRSAAPASDVSVVYNN